MNNIILIGAGGPAKSCADVIERTKKFKISGLIEKNMKKKKLLNYVVLGTESKMSKLRRKFKYAFICIGHIKTAKKRILVFKTLVSAGYKLPVIISPVAYVSKKAQLKSGTLVAHGAIINAYSKIGLNCIINTRAVIEHDVEIGDHCHVSTGALINGGSNIGEQSFIGSGAIIFQGVSVGRNCIIGAGSIIKKNIPDNKIIK